MNTLTQARQLLEATTRFHDSLIQQARAIGKLQEILEFIVECISFAEAHFPPSVLSSWTDGNQILDELSERAQPIYNTPVDALQALIEPVYTTSGSMATGTFSMLTDNFRFLEDNESRSGYNDLAGKYRVLLSGPEAQDKVHVFLGPLNASAQIKFDQSLQEIQSLPKNEDPQGPLMTMRSAIELALESLLQLTPLTKRERGDLKKIDYLPTIAQYLGTNELSKVDLILANNQLDKLKSQLSASKEKPLSRSQADALMNQAVALLNLIAGCIKLPDNRTAP